MSAATELRLDYAERLATAPDTFSIWARCATWLIRLALEGALRELWLVEQPELAGCTAKAQLLALGKFRGPTVQRRATELWHALSWAAHHHQYELPPSASEINDWLGEARELLRDLAP